MHNSQLGQKKITQKKHMQNRQDGNSKNVFYFSDLYPQSVTELSNSLPKKEYGMGKIVILQCET